MKLFTDAGTLNNGKRGYQKTRICVADEHGKILLERFIGDYTNNEGEVLAIKAAIEEIPGDHKDIFTDSSIAKNWIIKGWNKKNKNKHLLSAGAEANKRLSDMIDRTKNLYYVTGCKLEWIPRGQNKAGWYLERMYQI